MCMGGPVIYSYPSGARETAQELNRRYAERQANAQANAVDRADLFQMMGRVHGPPIASAPPTCTYCGSKTAADRCESCGAPREGQRV